MTSATEDGAAERPARGPLSRRNLLIGGGVAALLVLGIGGYLMLGSEQTAPVEAVAPEAAPAFYINLPDMTVNLSSIERAGSFVRLSISLQVPDEAMIAEIEAKLPVVLDAFQVYLRELRLSDLEGSAGLFRLKEELQRRINIAVYPARVDQVLFRSLVVQ